MTRSLVTKKTDISYVRSSRNSNLMNMLQIMSVHISSGLVLHLDVASLKAPFLKVQKGVTPSREKESEKSKVIEESDSTIPDPSHQTVTSTPPVIAPFTEFSYPKPSSLVTPPPINTEATTITTSLPKITPFIALQLRVARLEQEMLKVLERHSADLIVKQLCAACVESSRITNPEKIRRRLSKPKRNKVRRNKISTYSIRNTANYHLYHALMEALIADEDAMDKEVADKVKDHKRKHDSASGSAQLLQKMMSKVQRNTKSDASASKQHPSRPSTGWKITDTRDADVDSSMHRSDPESEQSEQSSDNIPMQMNGHVSELRH
ncbi:hypothetical protein Tco_0493265 [Tanacetum coccineum]